MALTLEKRAFRNGTNSIMTESGEIIPFDEKTMNIAFQGKPPKWYQKTTTVILSNIKDESIIGDYIAPVYVGVA